MLTCNFLNYQAQETCIPVPGDALQEEHFQACSLQEATISGSLIMIDIARITVGICSSGRQGFVSCLASRLKLLDKP